MKFWIGIVLSLVVLLAFSPRIEAGSPSGQKPPIGKKERFQRKDTNKDGQISKEEWVKYNSDKFTKIDTNGDGFLTEEELKACYEAKKKGPKPESKPQ